MPHHEQVDRPGDQRQKPNAANRGPPDPPSAPAVTTGS
jgi:hypothetical protein